MIKIETLCYLEAIKTIPQLDPEKDFIGEEICSMCGKSFRLREPKTTLICPLTGTGESIPI